LPLRLDAKRNQLMLVLDRYLSANDRKHILSGFRRGMKDSSVYVEAEGRWIAFTPDDASCYRVQGVLNDYKAALTSD
jgi:hypothetical protein